MSPAPWDFEREQVSALDRIADRLQNISDTLDALDQLFSVVALNVFGDDASQTMRPHSPKWEQEMLETCDCDYHTQRRAKS